MLQRFHLTVISTGKSKTCQEFEKQLCMQVCVGIYVRISLSTLRELINMQQSTFSQRYLIYHATLKMVICVPFFYLQM